VRWRIGIDENGLGPQLGPLLVTAVLGHTSAQAEQLMQHDPERLLSPWLDDSKRLVAHHNVALGEAWARVVLDRIQQPCCCPDQLIDHISLLDRAQLQRLCPHEAREQCWSSRDERFEAADDGVDEVRADLQRLQSSGLDIVWVRSAIVCTRCINDARGAGQGRLQIDLRAMEELLMAGRQRAGEPLTATCGKVGGMRHYCRAFTVLSSQPCVTVQETPERSHYRFGWLGDVHFVRDADGRDPLVALASLIGKYLRELLMMRIVRHYRRQLPSLDDASGYNDPVTDRFIQATRPLRTCGHVPETCFLRERSPKRRGRP
jgi:ribonuclease HII